MDKAVIEQHKEGVVLNITIQPRASREKIVGLHNDSLKVAVSAPPVEGAANEALIKVLAERFKLAKSKIEIISGATSRKKRVLLRGVDIKQAEKILDLGN